MTAEERTLIADMADKLEAALKHEYGGRHLRIGPETAEYINIMKIVRDARDLLAEKPLA